MRAFFLATLLFLVGLAVAAPKWHQLDGYTFDKYLEDFPTKIYGEDEQAFRRVLFEENLAKIKRDNLDQTRTWKSGVNQYTDWTPEEFRRLMGYDKHIGHKQVASRQNFLQKMPPVNASALPTNVDWRERGIISAVKDQGQCGSCWTFATTETIESYHALATGNLFVGSEQQILDCTPNPNDCGGQGGCEGGTPELAINRIVAMGGGFMSEWVYPYTSYQGQNFPKCQYSPGFDSAKVSGYIPNPSNEWQPFAEALATHGPLAVNVEASTWSSYESGVFNGCNKTHPDIDHVVQAVGYGTDPQLGPYYLVRNSWSPAWGELGYIRLYRSADEDNNCGIDLVPQDGTGCNNGPKEVKVCGTCGILYDTVRAEIKHH